MAEDEGVFSVIVLALAALQSDSNQLQPDIKAQALDNHLKWKRAKTLGRTGCGKLGTAKVHFGKVQTSTSKRLKSPFPLIPQLVSQMQ